jgi:hypothetical protein
VNETFLAAEQLLEYFDSIKRFDPSHARIAASIQQYLHLVSAN